MIKSRCFKDGNSPLAKATPGPLDYPYRPTKIPGKIQAPRIPGECLQIYDNDKKYNISYHFESSLSPRVNKCYCHHSNCSKMTHRLNKYIKIWVKIETIFQKCAKNVHKLVVLV